MTMVATWLNERSKRKRVIWCRRDQICRKKKIDEVDSGKVGGCSAPHLPTHHPPGLEHLPPLHWPPEQSAVHLQSAEKISKRATYPTTDSNSILPATPSFKRMVARSNPTKTPTLGSRGPACTFLKKCLYILHHHHACDHHHHSTMRNFQWICMIVHNDGFNTFQQW